VGPLLRRSPPPGPGRLDHAARPQRPHHHRARPELRGRVA
jgi:hypothetical protein